MAIRPTLKEENPEADFGEIVSLDLVCVYAAIVWLGLYYMSYLFCSHDAQIIYAYLPLG